MKWPGKPGERALWWDGVCCPVSGLLGVPGRGKVEKFSRVSDRFRLDNLSEVSQQWAC